MNPHRRVSDVELRVAAKILMCQEVRHHGLQTAGSFVAERGLMLETRQLIRS